MKKDKIIHSVMYIALKLKTDKWGPVLREYNSTALLIPECEWWDFMSDAHFVHSARSVKDVQTLNYSDLSRRSWALDLLLK